MRQEILLTATAVPLLFEMSGSLNALSNAAVFLGRKLQDVLQVKGKKCTVKASEIARPRKETRFLRKRARRKGTQIPRTRGMMRLGEAKT